MDGIAAEAHYGTVGVYSIYLSLGGIVAISTCMLYVVTEVSALFITHTYWIHYLSTDLDDVAEFRYMKHISFAQQNVVI